ncbi:MAG: hypothetical protein GQ583_11390 [Methyloprofundus sp.]|nr:hypothetical protein [Methyloprofundus sp.]
MKTSLMIGMLTAAITLIPSVSSANSNDSQYPATSFQPKVIYQDQEAKAAGSRQTMAEKSVFDPKYPATSFQPKVIFQDKEAVIALGFKQQMGEKSVFDPKYPAANFAPKVIYP